MRSSLLELYARKGKKDNMNVQFVKRVDYRALWKGKDGKERPSIRHYAVVNIDGVETWLMFEPTKFSYERFGLICKTEIIKNENESK